MEYRSGGTGGPHPGVDIFPDLSPRANPYCGVKCSQGLHFPVTDRRFDLGVTRVNYSNLEVARF